MALLLRFAAFIGLWLFTRRRKAGASELVRRMDRLPWSQKARLVWLLVQDERVPILVRGIVLIPALYIISPIDLLPDLIPFLGRLDDAAVFALAVDLLSRLAPVYVLEEHLNSVAGPGTQRGRAAA
jgi:uncharacterized membrane protein YkvA (DUF1232 family)